MKKFIIAGTFCAVALLGGSQAALAEETTTTTTTSNTEMLAKIQDLMKLIADLQAKLAEVRGEVKELVKELAVGAEGDDVKEIQEILASDPSLFGVKPTGYYGPLTEAAIEKFQARYGLPVTGVVDEATLEVMRELKMEKKNGMVPPGLVKSDEVKARIKARLQEKWGDCVWGEKFRASDCKKGNDDDMDDEDDSDDDDNSSATKEEALAAIKDAQDAVDTLKDELADLVDEDADEDVIDDARDDLKEAQKKLFNARRALAKGEFGDAVEKAEDAQEAASGDDSSDDEDDDSDEDEDDEDDEDDDDEEDDEDDEDEDDD
jgi:hypothetical protein